MNVRAAWFLKAEGPVGRAPHEGSISASDGSVCGRVRIIAEPRALDDVNDAMDEVLSGKVLARLVFEY